MVEITGIKYSQRAETQGFDRGWKDFSTLRHLIWVHDIPERCWRCPHLIHDGSIGAFTDNAKLSPEEVGQDCEGNVPLTEAEIEAAIDNRQTAAMHIGREHVVGAAGFRCYKTGAAVIAVEYESKIVESSPLKRNLSPELLAQSGHA